MLHDSPIPCFRPSWPLQIPRTLFVMLNMCRVDVDNSKSEASTTLPAFQGLARLPVTGPCFASKQMNQAAKGNYRNPTMTMSTTENKFLLKISTYIRLNRLTVCVYETG